MENTIILPAWLITSPQETPSEGWGVRVVGDEIADVAPNHQLKERYPEDRVWTAPGAVLAPGFVNAHTHLYGLLAHGIPLAQAPSGFWPFLEEFWWPLVEDRLDLQMINAATDYQCVQMLKSGVTSFYDCIEAPYALPGCLPAQAEVVAKYGLRAVLSFEATERVSRENGQLGLQENVDFVDACRVEGGLISGLICHHTTFTCSAPFIQQAYALAQERGVLLHAHVSEGTYEPEYAQRTYGLRPIPYYASLGVAGDGFLASQCVQVDGDEIAQMAETGVRVTHMPLSNCEVGGGIAPIPDLVAAGVKVGLGSDGYIDDFFEVMRGAFLIHKASHQDPRVMPADLVWYLATEGGAAALGLEKVGRLTPGWQADLQLIDCALPTPVYPHNLFEQLLLYRNGTHVRDVLVAGRHRVRRGEVADADLDSLTAHVHEAAKRLWSLGTG